MPRKTRKGVIHHKPLKIPETNPWFLRMIQQSPEREGFADDSVNKIKGLAFRLLFWDVFTLSGLDSRFLLRNEVFLSSWAQRFNGMKSKKWGLCPRRILKKRFSRNEAFAECRGMCWWNSKINFPVNWIFKTVSFEYPEYRQILKFYSFSKSLLELVFVCHKSIS